MVNPFLDAFTLHILQVSCDFATCNSTVTDDKDNERRGINALQGTFFNAPEWLKKP
jgi:hypothetical protein